MSSSCTLIIGKYKSENKCLIWTWAYWMDGVVFGCGGMPESPRTEHLVSHSPSNYAY